MNSYELGTKLGMSKQAGTDEELVGIGAGIGGAAGLSLGALYMWLAQKKGERNFVPLVVGTLAGISGGAGISHIANLSEKLENIKYEKKEQDVELKGYKDYRKDVYKKMKELLDTKGVIQTGGGPDYDSFRAGGKRRGESTKETSDKYNAAMDRWRKNWDVNVPILRRLKEELKQYPSRGSDPDVITNFDSYVSPARGNHSKSYKATDVQLKWSKDKGGLLKKLFGVVDAVEDEKHWNEQNKPGLPWTWKGVSGDF
jgi:hypothetical protein